MKNHRHPRHRRLPLPRVTHLALSLLLLATIALESAWAIPLPTRTLMRRAIPFAPLVKPAQPRNLLLVFDPTDDPDDRPHMLQAMLHETLFRTKAATLHQSFSAREFDDPEQLSAKFDAIVFINDAGPLFAQQNRRDSLINFLDQGKGIIFLHDGIQTANHWFELQAFAGGKADTRLEPAATTINVVGTEHQLNQPINATTLTFDEAILNLSANSFSPAVSRLLLTAEVHNQDSQDNENNTPDNIIPVSWLHALSTNGPRVFCSTLGSTDEIYYNPGIIKHWLAGLQFALGDLTADTQPTARLEPAPATLAECLRRLASLADDTNRSLQSAAATFIDQARAAGPSARLPVEQQLIQLLTADDATLSAKRFACRQLAVVGRSAALPQLIRLLDQPDLRTVAKSTLTAMPSFPAAVALEAEEQPREEPSQTLMKIVRDSNQPAARRAASLEVLGQRKTTALFEEAYTKYLQAEDPLLRRAAIRYLGKVGYLQKMKYSRDFIKRYLETDDEEDAKAYAQAIIDYFMPGNGRLAYGSIFTHNINADEIVTPREAYRAGVVAKVIGGNRGSQMIYFFGISDDPKVWDIMQEVLSNWPEGQGHKGPFALATQSKRAVDQKPLVRTFVRLMSELQSYPPFRRSTAFQQAFAISRWDDVDLEILHALAFVPDPVSLEVALHALESRTNLQTRRAAVRVIVLVAEKISLTHQPQSLTALTKALEFMEANDPENKYRLRAQKLLDQLQQPAADNQ